MNSARISFAHCPLHEHFRDGNFEAISNIIAQTSNVKKLLATTDSLGCTPLHRACMYKHTNTEILTLLLDNGAEVSVRDDDHCLSITRT